MNHDSYDEAYIRDVLASVRTIALVGASANQVRPSYFVLKYLIAKGYAVTPINPVLAGQQIAGATVHLRLADTPGPIDMVDIFRNSEAALGVVEDAIAEQRRLCIGVIWMQLGVRNDEAARRAEGAGMRVVMNRCPKIEYGRLSGEIGWAGVNSGTLSSARGVAGPTGQSLRLGRG